MLFRSNVAAPELRIFKPQRANGHGVLVIPGGGYQFVSVGNEGADFAANLTEHGYTVFVLVYRLPGEGWQQGEDVPLMDAQRAMRVIRANAARWSIDARTLSIVGFSAGGHLAQFLGVTAGVKEFEGVDNPGFSSAVTCVVNVYGPSDFTKSYGKSVDAHIVLPMWLGGDVESARARHIQSSPLNWVNPNAAPTLLIHGTEDKYVAYEQAVWMRDRLTACGVSVELLTLEGAGHGFKGADAEKAEAALIAYFEKKLKP